MKKNKSEKIIQFFQKKTLSSIGEAIVLETSKKNLKFTKKHYKMKKFKNNITSKLRKNFMQM